MRPGLIYDSNLRIISDTLREIGCESVTLGIVGDDPDQLRARVTQGLVLDGLVLSGGTSKGGGDFTARVIEELATVVCHGVAVKPGKPLCLEPRLRPRLWRPAGRASPTIGWPTKMPSVRARAAAGSVVCPG